MAKNGGGTKRDRQKHIEGTEPFVCKEIEDAYNTVVAAAAQRDSALEEIREAKEEIVKHLRANDLEEYRIGGRKLYIEPGHDSVKIAKIRAKQTANA